MPEDDQDGREAKPGNEAADQVKAASVAIFYLAPRLAGKLAWAAHGEDDGADKGADPADPPALLPGDGGARGEGGLVELGAAFRAASGGVSAEVVAAARAGNREVGGGGGGPGLGVREAFGRGTHGWGIVGAGAFGARKPASRSDSATPGVPGALSRCGSNL